MNTSTQLRRLEGRAAMIIGGSRGIHPGPTDTDLNPADGPHADVIKGFTTLARYAGPAEIAATVAHLASDDASYITGTEIYVDGGFTV